MTISNTTVRQLFTGDGATVAFAIPFVFQSTSEIKVYLRDEVDPDNITETLQVLTTNYTLTGGTPSQPTTVTFVSAPAGTKKVLILRVTAKTQTADYLATGPFPAETHELTLDKIVQQMQELTEVSARSLKFKKTSALTNSEITDSVEASGVIFESGVYQHRLLSELGSVGPIGPQGVVGPPGGGSAGIFWDNEDGGPIRDIENNALVYKFEDGLTQYLYGDIKVPQSYIAGGQIKLRAFIYHTGSSATQLITSVSTLIPLGTAIDSVTNQRTSTNAAVTAGDKVLAEIVLDLTSATGQINGVSVAIGNLIRVRLERGTDTSTSEIRLIESTVEVTFV